MDVAVGGGGRWVTAVLVQLGGYRLSVKRAIRDACECDSEKRPASENDNNGLSGLGMAVLQLSMGNSRIYELQQMGCKHPRRQEVC